MYLRRFFQFFHRKGLGRPPIARFKEGLEFYSPCRNVVLTALCMYTAYIYHRPFHSTYYGLLGFPVISECHSSEVDSPQQTCQTASCAQEDKEALPPLTAAAEARIKREISDYEIVLFMKGNASKPACKFSKQALDILKASKAPTIRTVNVLETPELRSGIKRFSNYPYIPQLYVRKKFIGGLDTISDMYNDGSLPKLLQG